MIAKSCVLKGHLFRVMPCSWCFGLLQCRLRVLKADSSRTSGHVRFVPRADSCTQQNEPLFDLVIIAAENRRWNPGGGAATRTALGLIEEITARRSTQRGFISSIVHMIVAPGSVTSALAPLRMARKLDPYRETARMALEPWLVEAALARLPQKLSPADQRTIVKATRTPHKVKWPEWWSE
jgi:hypothetical protein